MLFQMQAFVSYCFLSRSHISVYVACQESICTFRIGLLSVALIFVFGLLFICCTLKLFDAPFGSFGFSRHRFGVLSDNNQWNDVATCPLL